MVIKLNNSTKKDWRVLEFTVPIKESKDQEDGSFLISGVAINETTTRNGITYVSEELSPSAASLRNKPILKDHVNSVDSIVGRTTENVHFNQEKNRIDFDAKIVDKSMREKIKAGLVTSVSIGAMVKDIEEKVSEDTGEVTHRIARGITFVELSLVAVPADPNAGLVHAMAESFTIKNNELKIVKDKDKEEILMTEEKTKLENIQLERVKIEEEIAQMKLEALKAEKDALLKVKEDAKIAQEAAEKAAKEVQDKTSGEVITQEITSEKTVDYVVERSEDFNGFAMTARRTI